MPAVNMGSKSTSPLRAAVIEPLESRVLMAGTGLKAEYFDNADLTNHKFTRTDATINFNFGSAAPDASMGADTYSIRWTGQVEAPVTGSFTFYVRQDDGFRAWGASFRAIDHFVEHDHTDEHSFTYNLVAGQRYAVRIEYFKGTGNGEIQLRWSGPGIAKQIVPKEYLYPAGALIPSPWVDNQVGTPFRVANTTFDVTGTFTIKGGGVSFDGTADQFNFANQFIAGNGTLTGNLASMQNTHAQAKSGGMFRINMRPDSSYVAVLFLPTGAARFQYRLSPGGPVTIVNGPATGQHWFKIDREGDHFIAYSSSVNGNWTPLGDVTLTGVSPNAFAGLAVCSHNTATLNKSTFDNVQVIRRPAPAPATPPPAIAIPKFELYGTDDEDDLLAAAR